MAETPPLRKFMFDKSFDNAVDVRTATPERKPVTLKPEQVDALKKEAFDAGFAAGQKTLGDEQTQQLKATIAQLDNRMAQSDRKLQEVHKAQEEQLRQCRSRYRAQNSSRLHGAQRVAGNRIHAERRDRRYAA